MDAQTPAITVGGADVTVQSSTYTSQGGTTIWSARANRVQIAAGATSGTQTNFDTTAVADGDVFTLDVDQVGTGTVGAELTVTLQIKCPVETS